MFVIDSLFVWCNNKNDDEMTMKLILLGSFNYNSTMKYTFYYAHEILFLMHFDFDLINVSADFIVTVIPFLIKQFLLLQHFTKKDK